LRRSATHRPSAARDDIPDVRNEHVSDTTRDLVIIGSGPAGYTAALYAARAGLAPVVLAGAVTAGGALMNTTEVENFPGFVDGVMGPELMENMQKQAERFGAEVIYDDVVRASLTGPVKTVETGTGDTYTARTVILATGSAYRELGLPNEKRLSGHGVSWCATCDGFFFRGKEVVVVGGGDSAVEEATFLTRFASKVTMVHRRDQLRASKIMADRAANDPKIEMAWNSEVVAIHGEEKVTGVTLRDTVTGAERELATSGVFVAIGHIPRNELLHGQVDLDENGYVLVGRDGARGTATNVDGVFASGDLVDHVYRQAITAAGTGCAAALDAQHYLTDLVDLVDEVAEAATDYPADEIHVAAPSYLPDDLEEQLTEAVEEVR
jgi:thioredoxin reductase (NADPH)